MTIADGLLGSPSCTRLCAAIHPGAAALVAFLILFPVVVGLQVWGGCYDSEFGGHPDEAAHYVTGLLIRDYVAAGAPGHPMTYAKSYYDHYPKVALGHWPPVFYVVQGAWTLAFSPSRASLLALMAVLTALSAAAIGCLVARDSGWLAGGLASLVFVTLPLVQQHAGMVMTEMLITLLVLLSILALGRYLDRPDWRTSALFGVLASAAILAKGTAVFLGLAVPLAIIGGRRWDLPRRPSLWLAAVLVVILCAPWTVVTMDLVLDGWKDSRPSVAFTLDALPYYSGRLGRAIGPAIAVLTVLGLGLGLGSRPPGRIAALAALLFSVLIFHYVIPCGLEPRHLVPALPAAIVLAASGGAWLARRLGALSRIGPRPAGALVAVVVIAVHLAVTFSVPPKRYGGFGGVAEAIMEGRGGTPVRALVSSDARGEGMFVSEMAMNDTARPTHEIVRASKALAASSWRGYGYQARFANHADVVSFLRDDGIEYVVVDTAIPVPKRVAHHALLADALAAATNDYRAAGLFPVVRADETWPTGLRLYRRRE